MRDPQRMKQEAKKQVFKNIGFLKWKLRYVKPHIMEQIINAFARSLLIYVGTPLVTTGLWRRRDIEHIERQTLKKAAMVPNNINPDIVANLTSEKRRTWEIIERLARKNQRTNDRQTALPWVEAKKW